MTTPISNLFPSQPMQSSMQQQQQQNIAPRRSSSMTKLKKIIPSMSSIQSETSEASNISLYDLIDKENYATAMHVLSMNPTKAQEIIKIPIPTMNDTTTKKKKTLYNNVLAIHKACEMKEIPKDLIKLLVISHPDGLKMKEDLFDRLPLHIAILHGLSYEIIEILIKEIHSGYPNSVRVKALHGRLPLHYACSLKDAYTPEDCENASKTIKLLLEEYPNAAEERDDYGWLPLHISCISEKTTIEILRMMVQVYPDAIAQKTIKGRSPLDLLQSYTNKNKEHKDVLIKYIHEMMNMMDLDWSAYNGTSTSNLVDAPSVSTYESNPYGIGSLFSSKLTMPKVVTDLMGTSTTSNASEPTNATTYKYHDNLDNSFRGSGDNVNNEFLSSIVTSITSNTKSKIPSQIQIQQDDDDKASQDNATKKDSQEKNLNYETNKNILVLLESLNCNMVEMQKTISNDLQKINNRLDTIEKDNKSIKSKLQLLEEAEQRRPDDKILRTNSNSDNNGISKRLEQVENTMRNVCEINEKFLESMTNINTSNNSMDEKRVRINEESTPRRSKNEIKQTSESSHSALEQEQQQSSNRPMRRISAIEVEELQNQKLGFLEDDEKDSTDESASESTVDDNYYNEQQQQQLLHPRPKRRTSSIELEMQDDLEKSNRSHESREKCIRHPSNFDIEDMLTDIESSVNNSIHSNTAIDNDDERSLDYQNAKEYESNELEHKLHQVIEEEEDEDNLSDDTQEQKQKLKDSGRNKLLEASKSNRSIRQFTRFSVVDDEKDQKIIIGGENPHHSKMKEYLQKQHSIGDEKNEDEEDEIAKDLLVATEVGKKFAKKESKWNIVKRKVEANKAVKASFDVNLFNFEPKNKMDKRESQRTSITQTSKRTVTSSINGSITAVEGIDISNFDDHKYAFDQFFTLGVNALSLMSHLNRYLYEKDITSTSPENGYGRMLFSSIGNRFLDPFSIDAIDVLYQFPSLEQQSEYSHNPMLLSPESLSRFFLPNGVRIRIIPKYLARQTEKIGWFGKGGDKFQIHAFTNETGQMSHGFSITITEELKYDSDEANDEQSILLYSLLCLRKQRKAAILIVRWWKKKCRIFYLNKAIMENGCLSQVIDTGSTGSRRRSRNNSIIGANEYYDPKTLEYEMNNSGTFARKSSFSDSIKLAEEVLDSSASGKKIRRFFQKLGQSSANIPNPNADDASLTSMDSSVKGRWFGLFHKDNTTNDNNIIEDSKKFRRYQRRGSAPLMYQDVNAKTDGAMHYADETLLRVSLNRTRNNSLRVENEKVKGTYGEVCKFVSKKARMLAKEAYNEMLKLEEEGDIILVQKCFVVLGTIPEEQCILLCALQQLIDLERKNDNNSSMTALQKRAQRILFFSSQQQQQISDTDRFSEFAKLHNKIYLSPQQAKVNYPSNEFEHVYSGKETYELNLPFAGSETMILPLPLPQISSEYGVARLVLRVKIKSLLLCLKLLLLERSVLLIGDSCEEVSACVFAMLDLLQPYKWCSAFIPMLPFHMFDFVSSPVPFLAGFATCSKTQLKMIETDYRVRNALQHGLSVLNVTEGKVLITLDPEVDEFVNYFQLAVPTNLASYQTRLEEFAQDKSSTMHSFKSFIERGLSPRESLTIHSMRRELKNHLSNLSNIVLNSYQDGWKHFGRYNRKSNEFIFFPSVYIQTLQCQLEYQAMFAHTQLFVGYLEDEKDITLINTPVKTDAALFIADWVYFRWHVFLKKHRTKD